MKYLGPFIGGIIFALGLSISGMTEPQKVIGFLDIFGNWDATLMFVLGGAVLVNGILYRIIIKQKRPLFEKEFHLPRRTDLDAKLIGGALLFGIGWGIAGLCPGPALASLVSLKTEAFIFILSYLVGTFGTKTILDRNQRKAPQV